MVTSVYNSNPNIMNNPKQIYNNTKANLLQEPIITPSGVLHYNGDSIRSTIRYKIDMEKYAFYAAVYMNGSFRVPAIATNLKALNCFMIKNYPPNFDKKGNWKIHEIPR